MSGPTTIRIDEIEYVRKDSIPNPIDPNSPVKIVILQHGWVMVGHWGQDGDACWLDDASVIERWGTTEGLGQLVNGPTKETRLKKCGRVEFHILGVVAAITADASKWW